MSDKKALVAALLLAVFIGSLFNGTMLHVQAKPPPGYIRFDPTGYLIYDGTYKSGNLASLYADDNNYFQVYYEVDEHGGGVFAYSALVYYYFGDWFDPVTYVIKFDHVNQESEPQQVCYMVYIDNEFKRGGEVLAQNPLTLYVDGELGTLRIQLYYEWEYGNLTDWFDFDVLYAWTIM